MGSYIVERVRIDNGGILRSKNVQLVGVAYKPNVADIRETPAEEIYLALTREGAKVSWHDPLVKSWKDQVSSPLGSEIAIVVTKHDAIESNEILRSANYIFDTTGKVIGATQL